MFEAQNPKILFHCCGFAYKSIASFFASVVKKFESILSQIYTQCLFDLHLYDGEIDDGSLVSSINEMNFIQTINWMASGV
jgi:hypothetical protein